MELTATFLIPLTGIGLIAGYWDLKENRIPNKLILSGLILSLFLYIFWFVYGFLILQDSSYFDYLISGLLNGFFSFLLGYFLWVFKFWSPGDGKLFGLYGLLFPLTLYSDFYIDYFPAYLVLINLAILFLASTTFKAVISLIKDRKEVLNKLTNRDLYTKKMILKTAQNAFSFIIDIATAMTVITGISNGSQFFGFSLNAFVIIGLLILFIYMLNKLKESYPKTRYLQYMLLVGYFGRFIVLRDFRRLILYFRVILVFLIIAGLFKKLLLLYIKNKETKEVKASKVEEGMVLNREWKRYFEKKLKDFESEEEEKFFDEGKLSGGLTKKQAQFIRNLFKEDPKYKVEVCQTFPFAPYIFVSALIIALTKGAYVHSINDLFMSLFGH